MAWTSMHFAVGMCGGAVVALAPCLILRRGWRHIPIGMTLGGLWAILPDCPRLWREDFTGLPFAATLGSKDFEVWLHSIGDLFFFHRSLDAQPQEFALLGLALIVGLYNVCLAGMWWRLRKRRRIPLTHDAYTPLPTGGCVYGPQVLPRQTPATGSLPPDGPYSDPVVGRIGSNRSA